MKPSQTPVVACVILAACAAALAAPPALGTGAASLDCAHATDSVERSTCQDSALAGLDGRLAAVYAEALKRHAEDGYADPRPAQGLWLEGLDRCAESADVGGCLESGYRRRIAELEIQYGQLEVPDEVRYDCGVFDLAVVFYPTDPPAAVLTPVGPHGGLDQSIAFAVPSGSGARYESANLSFWEHHGEAALVWSGRDLKCRAH
jgi:uncharacterized protein